MTVDIIVKGTLPPQGGQKTGVMLEPQAQQGLRSQTTLFRVLIALIAAGALVQLGISIARAAHFRAQLPPDAGNVFLGYALLALTAGVACITALLMVWRAGHRADARFLALFLAIVALFWGSLIQFLHVSVGVANGKQQVDVGVTLSSAYTGAILGAWVLGAAALLHFGAVFPTDVKRPRWLTDRRIWLVPLLLAALDGLITTADVLNVGINPAQMPKPALIVAVAYLIVGHLLIPIALMLFGIGLLLRNYRLASRADRDRALWILAGFAAALGVLVVGIVFGQVIDTLPATASLVTLTMIVIPALAPLVIVLCMGIAVFYAGVFDPGLVIRRTTMYALLGLLATGLFALVENVITATLTEWFDLPASVGTFAGSIAVALAIIPLRERLKPAIDKRVSPPTASTLPPATET